MGCHTWAYVPTQKSYEEIKAIALKRLRAGIRGFCNPRLNKGEDFTAEIAKLETIISEIESESSTYPMLAYEWAGLYCGEDGKFYDDSDEVNDLTFRSSKYETELKTEQEAIAFLNDESVWNKADDAEEVIRRFFARNPGGFIELG